MKKFLAYFAVIILVGVLSLSLVAYTNNASKKLKAETGITTDTTKTHCAEHKTTADSTACADHACKHHKEVTAESK